MGLRPNPALGQWAPSVECCPDPQLQSTKGSHRICSGARTSLQMCWFAVVRSLVDKRYEILVVLGGGMPFDDDVKVELVGFAILEEREI